MPFVRIALLLVLAGVVSLGVATAPAGAQCIDGCHCLHAAAETRPFGLPATVLP